MRPKYTVSNPAILLNPSLQRPQNRLTWLSSCAIGARSIPADDGLPWMCQDLLQPQIGFIIIYVYIYNQYIYIYHIYIYYIYTYTIECRAWVTSILDYQPPQIWSFPINTGVKEGTGIYIYIYFVNNMCEHSRAKDCAKGVVACVLYNIDACGVCLDHVMIRYD